MFPTRRDDHRLCLPVKHLHNVATEMLNDDLTLLADGGRMQRSVACDLTLPPATTQFGIIFYRLL